MVKRLLTESIILLFALSAIGAVAGIVPVRTDRITRDSSAVHSGTAINEMDVNIVGDVNITGVLQSLDFLITSLTASRLTASDTDKTLISTDLIDWIAGTLDEITVTDDGAGGVILGIEETDPCWVAWLSIPPNVSVFTNDAGYLTSYSETDPCHVLWLSGPPNISEFTNDAGYLTAYSETDPCAMPYLDQAVKTTSSPTFADVNLTDNTSLIKVDGATFIANDGTGNVFLGEDVFNYDSGSGNIGIGYQAGYYSDTEDYVYGSTNIYIGYKSGYGGTPATNNTGMNNIGLGYQTLYYNTSGQDNMAIGAYASGKNTTGSMNTGLGSWTLYANQTGGNNTVMGSYAGYQATGSNGTIVGCQAGYSLTSGASNVFIGYKSGYRQTTNGNLLIIDNQDRTSTALELSNSLIYGVFNATVSSQSLRFNTDAITFNGGTNADIVFTYTGTTNSGSMSWMEDEDYFKFSDDILMNSAEKIYLRDTALGIYSQADTFLDLFADGGVRIGDSSAGAPTNYVQFAPTGNMTFTGTASFNLPTSAAPTLDAAGELAHDTTVSGLANGCLSYYNGAAIRYVVDLAALPSDDDYVVAYDADADGFYMKHDASGGSAALDDLTDVNAPSPNDGDVIIWDDAKSEWVSSAPIAGAEVDPCWVSWLAGPPNISEFTNDSGYITTWAETDPCLVLHNNTYDHNDIADGATAYSWGNHSLAGYLTDITGENLDDLLDVNAPSPSANYVLTFDANDSVWKAKAASGGGSFSWSSAPDKPTDSGTAGDIAYDSTNLYVCVATDTWRRTALSTWQNVILLETGDKVLFEDSANMAEE